jgi:hypothetical protein
MLAAFAARDESSLQCCLCRPHQAAKTRRTIIDADAKKERRRIQHSAPGSRVVKPARKKKVVTVQE